MEIRRTRIQVRDSDCTVQAGAPSERTELSKTQIACLLLKQMCCTCVCVDVCVTSLSPRFVSLGLLTSGVVLKQRNHFWSMRTQLALPCSLLCLQLSSVSPASSLCQCAAPELIAGSVSREERLSCTWRWRGCDGVAAGGSVVTLIFLVHFLEVCAQE